MRKATLLAGLLLLAGLPVQAQEAPSAEIFAGYSLASVDFVLARETFGYGFQFQGAANRGPSWGIVGDFGVDFKSIAGTNFQFYQYMGGLRFVSRGENVNAFTHMLFGAATLRGGGGSETGFAMGFGGGADISLNERFAVRVIQFDYLPTRLDLFGTGGEWMNNIRLGFGIVFKAGGG